MSKYKYKSTTVHGNICNNRNDCGDIMRIMNKIFKV